jgi:hypothetical protein
MWWWWCLSVCLFLYVVMQRSAAVPFPNPRRQGDDVPVLASAGAPGTASDQAAQAAKQAAAPVATTKPDETDPWTEQEHEFLNKAPLAAGLIAAALVARSPPLSSLRDVAFAASGWLPDGFRMAGIRIARRRNTSCGTRSAIPLSRTRAW